MHVAIVRIAFSVVVLRSVHCTLRLSSIPGYISSVGLKKAQLQLAVHNFQSTMATVQHEIRCVLCIQRCHFLQEGGGIMGGRGIM